MNQALHDLLERLLQGTELAPEDLLWALLMVGLVFSFVHLLSMLVTRWGDKRASTKALVLSLLLHVTCALGVVFVSETNPFRVPDPEEETPQVEIRELVLEDDTQPEREEAGNRPIWDRIPEPAESELERAEANPRDLPPIDDPSRTEEPREKTPIEIADAAFRPDRVLDSPLPADAPNAAPRRREADLPELDDPEAERRDEPSVDPARRVERRNPLGGVDPQLVARDPRDGGAPVPQPDFESIDRRIPSIVRREPDALLRDAPVGPVISRQSAPAPSPAPEIGVDVAEQPRDPGGPGGIPAPRRLAADAERSGGAVELGGGVPERTPAADAIGAGRPQRLNIDDAIARHVPSGSLLDELPTRLAPPSIGPTGPRRMTPASPEARPFDEAERGEIARRFGGSENSEEAVDRALAWLASVQEPQGYWDADKYGAGTVKWETTSTGERVDRDHAGKDADAGITGLALLAFFAAGHTPYEGRYARTVQGAIDWLAEQQTDDGFLGARARHYARTYSHAIATFALAEALRVLQDVDAPAADRERLAAVVTKAVAWSVDQQNQEDGGWRYVKGQSGDTSIFGWQLMAMKSAQRAGIDVPAATRQGMVRFLTETGLGRQKGLAAYRPGEKVSPAMTAEALFCKQQFGLRQNDPQSVEAIAYLREHLPSLREYDLYYWYYGTLAMFHHGGEPWTEWNTAVRDLLVAEQTTSGEHAGSWEPRDKWSPYGGRVYSTAMATLCLESYYRFFRKDDRLATGR